jgi:hypothetical protein
MELSPFQLIDYFVHSIRVDASLKFDANRPFDLDIEALEVEHSCTPHGDEPDRLFSLQMTIRQKVPNGKNIPYTYEIHLVGFLKAHPEFPADRLLHAVEVNGPTMLFGAAREIIRAATGRGPYGPVLIPSTTFFKPGPPSSKSTKKASGKAAASKRSRAAK